MPSSPPIPAEFLAQYDAERAAKLCRRAVWYSVTILAIVGLSWVMTLSEVVRGTAFSGGDSASPADLLTDTLFTAIFTGTLVYFARRVRSRAEVVRAFQWVIAVAGLTAVAVTPLVMNASIVPGATLDHTPEADLAQAFATLMTVFLLHFLASVFVALTPKEGLRPLLPIYAAFAAWVLLISAGTWTQRIALLVFAPLIAVPGLAWSWWRYRSFAERFHTRALQKRYTEVSRELSDARRIHEALFPPPITRGPVRVTYHYEPMREIGGDFLFVRPLAFPPSSPDGPVLVVLIDVTGHGIAAALAVNRLHAELETLCARGPLPEPAAVIRALNAFTEQVLAPGAMFATALAICVEPGPTPATNGTVRWSSAGHPPAYLRTPAGVEPLESTATMLGVLPPDLFDCDEGRRDLPEGSTIIAFTDGASESTDPRGQQLGLPALRRLIETAPSGPLADHLAHTITIRRAAQPTDDTLIVEITPQPVE